MELNKDGTFSLVTQIKTHAWCRWFLYYTHFQEGTTSLYLFTQHLPPKDMDSDWSPVHYCS